ncbi:MAG TPA: response regulator [Verrucomicrobiae bacterium]|jgi:two-component system chemotaxis response regulator CheY
MKLKILVVDDSGLARRLNRKLLEELEYEVEEACDGAQALEKYALGQHDFVLLDIVMHGMTGFDVLKKLRELNPKLQIIMVTADIQKSTREQVKEFGAAAIVNKPINKEQLAEALNLIKGGGNAWN